MRRATLIRFAVLSALVLAVTAHAAGPQWPDAKSIEAERAHTLDVFGQVPNAKPGATKGAAPSEFRNLPAAPAGVDVSAIAERYRELKPPEKLPQPPKLYAFVSFSLPAQSLKRLSDDAARAGAMLVLRGYVNGDSIRSTTRALHALIGEAGRSAWQIDPPAFERYAIESAPTYVLARHANNDPQDFVSVSGDVSLAYALERIAHERPAYAATAAVFRKRLGE